MTNRDMLKIAMKQSAEDMGCSPDDYLSGENVIVPFRLGANARKYYKLPITCQFVSYGNNIVAAVTDQVADLASEYVGRYEFYHCFETPNMHWLNDRLAEKGHKICFMAEYYLFDADRAPDLSCAYETRVLGPADFAELYLPEWSNALCRERKQLDVLGIGAYDQGKLVGLAGCSADCEDMWQIGVDVLPEYRRRGIASALTNALAKAIMERGKVPFYCSAWSNIRSVRNAVKSGFVPAWVEMTAKPAHVVDEFNKTDREKRVIAACGNDCSACPRYVSHPYGKTEDELLHTAELWMKIGYRDHIVSNEEIACTGCKPENWCRYHIVKCCQEKGIKTCAECDEYPCATMQDCFSVTKSFEPKCREVCTDQEYEMLKKAFFEKEQNLKKD